MNILRKAINRKLLMDFLLVYCAFHHKCNVLCVGCECGRVLFDLNWKEPRGPIDHESVLD